MTTGKKNTYFDSELSSDGGERGKALMLSAHVKQISNQVYIFFSVEIMSEYHIKRRIFWPPVKYGRRRWRTQAAEFFYLCCFRWKVEHECLGGGRPCSVFQTNEHHQTHHTTFVGWYWSQLGASKHLSVSFWGPSVCVYKSIIKWMWE